MRKKKNEGRDIIENKKTMDFLLEVTGMLISSDVLIGRNEKMFVLDASRASELLHDENLDLGSLFHQLRLIVDNDEMYGAMNIVESTVSYNNIIFYVIAGSLGVQNLEGCKEVNFPYFENVREWFLSLPKLTPEDKKIYEDLYKESRDVFDELISENSREIIDAIFSSDGQKVAEKKEQKLH